VKEMRKKLRRCQQCTLFVASLQMLCEVNMEEGRGGGGVKSGTKGRRVT
jgi:hypothetical protein